MKLDHLTTARNLPSILCPRFIDGRLEVRNRIGVDNYGHILYCTIEYDGVTTFAPKLPLEFIKTILNAIVMEVELP